MFSITTATMATDIKTPSSTLSSLSFMPVSLRAVPSHARDLRRSERHTGDGLAGNSATASAIGITSISPKRAASR